MLSIKNKIKLDCADWLTRSANQKFMDVGYYILPNLLNQEAVQKITSQLSRIPENEFIREENDIRCFRVSNYLNNELYNSVYTPLKKLFHDNVSNCSKYKHFYMYNMILKSGIGSGGSWHRDSGYSNGYKLIISLNGTDSRNGPFQFVPYSHTKKAIIDNSKLLGYNKSKTRFTTDEVNEILVKGNLKTKTVKLDKGDAIFVNTRCLHRGKPAEIGGRLALTSYSFKKIPKHMRSLFDAK